MLPTLENFGITPPVYLRKIPSKGRWNPENCKDDEERVLKIVDAVFTETIYSIWLINSEEDFYCTIASLSARRTPQQQDIDFIWITEAELQKFSITKKQTREGDCLYAQKLHYNIIMGKDLAIDLCRQLIYEKREAQRCKKKKMTKVILSTCPQLITHFGMLNALLYRVFEGQRRAKDFVEVLRTSS